MSRPSTTSGSTSINNPSSSAPHYKRRKRRHSSTPTTHSSSSSASPLLPSTPAAAVLMSTSAGRTITRRPHSSHATTAAGAHITPATTPRPFSSSAESAALVADLSMNDVPPAVTISLPAPLPAVVVLPVTSPRLATALPEVIASASTALSLLPFYTRAPTQKLILHSLLLSSTSQSLLLTFSSLAPTSPLPQSLVGLFTAAPVPALLPTPLSKRQLKTALSTWQRPAKFTMSSTIAYLTPFLIDLLSLSPSTTPTASSNPLTWHDSWTLLPPTAADVQQLQRVVQYGAEQLRLYECAHTISTAFTKFATEQLQHVHAFNLRFVPLLPVSPYRFTLDSQVEATFPTMRLPTSHRVHITSTHAEAERAIGQLMSSLPAQQQQWIGFDTESRPMFVAGQPNRPISLVQLSSLSVSVLCRVRREAGLPPALVRLLVDPNVRKVGQGIGGDMRLLHAQYGGTTAAADAALPDTLLSSPSSHSLIDLESLSSSYSIHRVGLASLTAAFLSLRLSKAAQLSNWERPTLSTEQVSYAALDSLVSLKLAQRLQQVRDDMQAIVSGWMEREGGRGGVDGGEVGVDEVKVWRWLTGKGLNGLVEVKDENGEVETSRKQRTKQLKQKQNQQASDVRPQQASEGSEQQSQQSQQQHRDKKRRKVAQSALRSAQPPQQSRQPRHRAVHRAGGASQHRAASDGDTSGRMGNGSSIAAAQ